MTSPIFDFSHLSPAERIQLAEELWDRLEPTEVPVDPTLAADLERRAEAHRREPERGRPWRDVLDDIDQRGA